MWKSWWPIHSQLLSLRDQWLICTIFRRYRIWSATFNNIKTIATLFQSLTFSIFIMVSRPSNTISRNTNNTKGFLLKSTTVLLRTSARFCQILNQSSNHRLAWSCSIIISTNRLTLQSLANLSGSHLNSWFNFSQPLIRAFKPIHFFLKYYYYASWHYLLFNKE